MFSWNKKNLQPDFSYLDPKILYFDSACQTLRPAQVIAAQDDYFYRFNACAGRVKYSWGRQLDDVTEETRQLLLKNFTRSAKEYTAAFTLNTTYGMNLLLQVTPGEFERIITSETEHNSVFLPTMTAARRLNIPRTVLRRMPDGSLEYEKHTLRNAIVAVSAMTNFDGQIPTNLKKLIADAHAVGGAVILDAAQAAVHTPDFIADCDADAICASAHKMHGPSLGFILVKKAFLKKLDPFFIGGGTVRDVREQEYDLISDDDSAYSILEPGLQNYSGIVGLRAALAFLNPKPDTRPVSEYIANALRELPVVLISRAGSPIICFYSEKIDSHRLALYLSEQNIFVRSGYFCCHYYLDHIRRLPPLLRLSVGMHNTVAQAEQAVGILSQILKNV